LNAHQRRGHERPVALAMHLLGGLRLALAVGAAGAAGAQDVPKTSNGAAGTSAANRTKAALPAQAADAGRAPAAPAAEGLETRHHVRALLALAGSSSQGVGRDEIVDLLWPNLGAAQGRNRLYHTVHLARKALSAWAWDDEWVVVRNSHVMIDERVWCDVRQLEATARQAENQQERRAGAGDLQALLPLCRGDWMPDLDIGSVGEALRSRVRKLQATVLRRVAQSNQTQGDTPSQRALLHSLLQLEATDEWAYHELMRLDLAVGRRHAVLRHFDKLSRSLSAQLGLRPSTQTSALAASASAQLQQTSHQAQAQPRGSLLVGREDLVQDLVAQTTACAGVWLLTGQSGIGKTSLAREVAHRLAPLMADGVCFVGLGDLGAAAPGETRESTAAACVRMLGLAASAGRDEQALLNSAVQHRQMLLVLDDLDVAEDAQALLSALPLALMTARVIATCRAPFGVAAKIANNTDTQTQGQGRPTYHHVQVPPLPTPSARAGLARATESASVTLFRMRCPVPADQQAQTDWQLDAVRLVRKLDGLPLAIELAAARTATMTPGEVLQHIERSLDTLTDGPVNLERRHRSLRASLDWSVQLLSPAAKAVYGAASVFTGTFESAEVMTLMPALGVQPHAVNGALQELLAGGLLARVNDHDRDRDHDHDQDQDQDRDHAYDKSASQPLRMLHLPRAHARAQTQAQGRWSALLDLRLAQICQIIDTHPLHFDSPLFAPRLRQIVAIEGEALSLLEHAKEHQPRQYVQMLVSLFDSWMCKGAGVTILRYADAAIHQAQQLDMPVEELSLRLGTNYALRTRDTPAKAEVFSRTLEALGQRVLALPVPAVANAANAAVAPSGKGGTPGGGVWRGSGNSSSAQRQLLAVRAVDGRAMCMVQNGLKEEAVKLLLAALATLQLQATDAGYWLLHTRIAYLTMRMRPGVTIDLDVLRPHCEGSPLWIEILRATYEDFSASTDWPYRQTVAEEIEASARQLRSPLLTFIGIWSKACGQLGCDDVRGGLLSLQEACELARRSGLEHLALDALPVRAMWHRYAQEWDSAEQCLRDAAAMPAQPSRDALVVRAPLQAAALHCLRGQAEAARNQLSAIPLERLQTVSDDELIRWSESAALLAKLLGRSEQVQALVESYRRFDYIMDKVPVVARFRNREFGALSPQDAPPEAQVNSLRTNLRARLNDFYDLVLSAGPSSV
jgi:predicted ATPase/DNA-binding SARP family transcriptional activator